MTWAVGAAESAVLAETETEEGTVRLAGVGGVLAPPLFPPPPPQAPSQPHEKINKNDLHRPRRMDIRITVVVCPTTHCYNHRRPCAIRTYTRFARFSTSRPILKTSSLNILTEKSARLAVHRIAWGRAIRSLFGALYTRIFFALIAFEKLVPHMGEETRRQDAIYDGRLIASGDCAKIGTRPDEFSGFRDHDPRFIRIKPKSILGLSRDLHGLC